MDYHHPLVVVHGGGWGRCRPLLRRGRGAVLGRGATVAAALVFPAVGLLGNGGEVLAGGRGGVVAGRLVLLAVLAGALLALLLLPLLGAALSAGADVHGRGGGAPGAVSSRPARAGGRWGIAAADVGAACLAFRVPEGGVSDAVASIHHYLCQAQMIEFSPCLCAQIKPKHA